MTPENEDGKTENQSELEYSPNAERYDSLNSIIPTPTIDKRCFSLRIREVDEIDAKLFSISSSYLRRTGLTICGSVLIMVFCNASMTGFGYHPGIGLIIVKIMYYLLLLLSGCIMYAHSEGNFKAKKNVLFLQCTLLVTLFILTIWLLATNEVTPLLNQVIIHALDHRYSKTIFFYSWIGSGIKSYDDYVNIIFEKIIEKWPRNEENKMIYPHSKLIRNISLEDTCFMSLAISLSNTILLYLNVLFEVHYEQPPESPTESHEFQLNLPSNLVKFSKSVTDSIHQISPSIKWKLILKKMNKTSLGLITKFLTFLNYLLYLTFFCGFLFVNISGSHTINYAPELIFDEDFLGRYNIMRILFAMGLCLAYRLLLLHLLESDCKPIHLKKAFPAGKLSWFTVFVILSSTLFMSSLIKITQMKSYLKSKDSGIEEQPDGRFYLNFESYPPNYQSHFCKLNVSEFKSMCPKYGIQEYVPEESYYIKDKTHCTDTKYYPGIELGGDDFYFYDCTKHSKSNTTECHRFNLKTNRYGNGVVDLYPYRINEAEERYITFTNDTNRFDDKESFYRNDPGILFADEIWYKESMLEWNLDLFSSVAVASLVLITFVLIISILLNSIKLCLHEIAMENLMMTLNRQND